MRIIYDRESDVVRFIMNDQLIDESAEVAPGCIFDYDKDELLVGFEILTASKTIDNPGTCDFSVV